VEFLIIPIILVGATGAWTGTGAPFLVAINSDAPQWVVELAGILSAMLVLSVVGACAKIGEEVTERRIDSKRTSRRTPGEP
jgi:membrane protein implicated in regulation of membrane protease activity